MWASLTLLCTQPSTHVQRLCQSSVPKLRAHKPPVSLPACRDCPLPWAGEQGCVQRGGHGFPQLCLFLSWCSFAECSNKEARIISVLLWNGDGQGVSTHSLGHTLLLRNLSKVKCLPKDNLSAEAKAACFLCEIPLWSQGRTATELFSARLQETPALQVSSFSHTWENTSGLTGGSRDSTLQLAEMGLCECEGG